MVASGGLLTASRALLDVVEASWVVKWRPVAVFGGPSLWRREEKTGLVSGGPLGHGASGFLEAIQGAKMGLFWFGVEEEEEEA